METKIRQNTIKILVVLSLFGGLLQSCEKDSQIPDINALGITYFPLEKGLFRVYNVDEITYSVLGNDTAFYQLKETVVDSFPNLENEFTYVIHRSIRQEITDIWGVDSVWTARRDLTRAIKIENNVPFIKLIFPLQEEKTWDGNALNSREEDSYEIEKVDESYTIGENNVNAVSVLQEDIDNLVSMDMRKEVFGENIGLVDRTLIQLEYCTEGDCFGQKIIERGISLKMTLVEYGKE